MYKKSNNPQVSELNKSHKERSVNLGDLKPIKRDGLRFCAWCGEGLLKHGNQKYCETECQRCAMAWAYPQKEEALWYLLNRQNWKCNLCQFDYHPIAILANQQLRTSVYYRHWAEDDYQKRFGLGFMKELKSVCPKDRRLEVDHILPIYKGGQSLGLDNHQAICYTCHKVKTSKDLKGKRK